MVSNDKVKIVIVGHVDHGKSTLIGRILYDTHMINSDKLNDMLDDNNNLDYAFFTDHFEEERNQRITIDTTQVFFKTNKREYVIIDAPGHSQFIVNMITGAVQARTAVIIVDAKEGIQEETKRHAYILSLLGIKRVIVAINKMDLVEYCEDIYDSLVCELKTFLEKIKIIDSCFVPIVAKDGDNIVDTSKNISWYKGKTLIELLDQIPAEIDECELFSTYPVQGVLKHKLDGEIKRIILGRLESGKFRVGDSICILPDNHLTTIMAINKFGEEPESIEVGECFGIETTKPLFIERGDIICSVNHRLFVKKTIKATIFWLDKSAGYINEKYYIRCATQTVSCKITDINRKIDSSTLETINDDMNEINKYEVAQVEIDTKTPLVYSDINELHSMARFVIAKDNDIKAVGTIILS